MVHHSTAMADDAVAIKISWMIENRNKWIYIECDVSAVKVIKRKRRRIST